MKKDVRTIGWLLLLGQLLFQGSALLVTLVAAVLGNGNFEVRTGHESRSFQTG